YEANGAAAISVLADERFFGGSLADLAAARGAVKLPVLCKEFILDPYQVYEARLAGADAVLLIAGILDRRQLREYRELAAGLGMASLVEVHDEVQLMAAVYSGAEIVGVNNRDLRTFEVSLDVTRSLLPWVPDYMVTVSESGIRSVADREAMAAMGVDVPLVGESLITAPDVGAATREISGVLVREEVSVK
ncbi:MAG: indole-3-glycerol phosphate synthase TrpC, partial [Chloroflexota bacterium]|nr:indole-3-glycerol phosphate synthase TrpC [Chloroflexota bacterium]